MIKKIAITGGIGSGKSLARKYIQEKGFPVFSCDEIYKELLKTKEFFIKIFAAFPNVCKDCQVDKRALAKEIFSDESKRQKLNSITHPLIMERLMELMNEAKCVVFAEVPLLFEGNFEGLFDAILVIRRPIADRIQSIQSRDGLSLEEAQRRIASQYNYDGEGAKEKLNAPNVFLIPNDKTKNDLKKEIENWIKNYL